MMTPADSAPSAADRPPSDHSLVRRFRVGDDQAARELYLRYVECLRALVRANASADLLRRLDADDIVQSVFRSFFHGAKQGYYDVPAGEELWKLLLVMALNKVRARGAYHRAAKRDVRLTRGGESYELLLETAQQDDVPDPFLSIVVDEVLERLPPEHRQMVELRMCGYAVAEIAQKTGRSKRSVERMLQESRSRLTVLMSERD
jgi:RNA polymerase sigma-70 factor (ECF subfamily)